MSALKIAKIQTGISNTPSNNFHTRAPEDGTWRLSRGNADGTPTDVLAIDADGNFSKAPVLGLGQTRQTFTSPARLPSTTYTHTGKVPMELSISFTLNSSTASGTLMVAGVETDRFQAQSANAAGSVRAIVQPGETYSISPSFGSLSVIQWQECKTV